MIEFQLSTKNLVRQDSTTVEMMGTMNPALRGVQFKVEYRLHKDEFRNPEDPDGDSIDLWCLHLLQINMTYVDKTEERTFEAMHECFEEDFITYYAQKLNEVRDEE